MAKRYVCLELGGTHLRLGIVAEDFSLLRFEKLPTAILSEAEDKVACLAELLRPLIDEAGRENVAAVSLALASLMNKERSVVYSSPMVHGFDNIALKAELEAALGLPVLLEKDVNILLLYEIRKQSLPLEGIVAGVFSGHRAWQRHLYRRQGIQGLFRRSLRTGAYSGIRPACALRLW